MCCGQRKGGANADHDPEKLALLRVQDDPLGVQASRTARLRLAPSQTTQRGQRNRPARLKSDGLLEGAQRWSAKTLDQIATNLDSKRVPITKGDRKAGEFPYYGASGIVDYVANYIFDGDTLLVSEDGANLLARSTPIAFPASGRYWVNNHAHILKFDHMATQRFVEFFLESIPLDEYITGAAQPKLNQKALNSIPIPLPATIAEQAQAVDQLDSLAMQSELLSRPCKICISAQPANATGRDGGEHQPRTCARALQTALAVRVKAVDMRGVLIRAYSARSGKAKQSRLAARRTMARISQRML